MPLFAPWRGNVAVPVGSVVSGTVWGFAPVTPNCTVTPMTGTAAAPLVTTAVMVCVAPTTSGPALGGDSEIATAGTATIIVT